MGVKIDFFSTGHSKTAEDMKTNLSRSPSAVRSKTLTFGGERRQRVRKGAQEEGANLLSITGDISPTRRRTIEYRPCLSQRRKQYLLCWGRVLSIVGKGKKRAERGKRGGEKAF